MLGGFDYIDPAYNLRYSGENGELDWQGNAGSNLRHGGLRSYTTAVQSNGKAVEYRSGMEFEANDFALAYSAAESQSEYNFAIGEKFAYNSGPWTMAPTTVASL